MVYEAVEKKSTRAREVEAGVRAEKWERQMLEYVEGIGECTVFGMIRMR